MLTETKRKMIRKGLAKIVEAGFITPDHVQGLVNRYQVRIDDVKSIAVGLGLEVREPAPPLKPAPTPAVRDRGDVPNERRENLPVKVVEVPLETKREVLRGPPMRAVRDRDMIREPSADTMMVCTYGELKRHKQAIRFWLRTLGVDVTSLDEGLGTKVKRRR